ncbi:MAG: hypothetical protein WCL21_15430 [Mariniphaga sp.]
MIRIKNRVLLTFNKYRGSKINRKIVVFESDDWGSIRMPSAEVYHKLLDNGIRVDKCHYSRYDSLANVEDFEMLFDILIKFKDVNGHHPVITANAVVANPDFDKIRESNYQQYFYEPFTETIKKYTNCSFELWKQGMDEHIFHPQFHGREHLNVPRWMRALQQNSKEMHLAFDCNMFGISSIISNEKNPSFMAALDADCSEDLFNQRLILEEGLTIFQDSFGYKSKSFIAPNYTWHSSIENTLHQNNVLYLQGDAVQREPDLNGKTRSKFHFLGEQNANKQIFLTRNCLFEPSSDKKTDWISSCLKDIKTAFSAKKPAIITCHRVNFIGGIDSENRKKNLNDFSILLTEISIRWPDVEFMTTDQLGDLIKKENETPMSLRFANTNEDNSGVPSGN